MRKCSSCTKIKDEPEFGSKSNGVRHQCKECTRAYYRDKAKTVDGLLHKIYPAQVSNSKRRGHQLPTYSLAEFRIKYREDNDFLDLYNKWAESGYKKNYSPHLTGLMTLRVIHLKI